MLTVIIIYQCDSRVLYVSPYDSPDIETANDSLKTEEPEKVELSDVLKLAM